MPKDFPCCVEIPTSERLSSEMKAGNRFQKKHHVFHLTTEWLLLPGEQVEAASASSLVRVVTQLPALPDVAAAADAAAAAAADHDAAAAADAAGGDCWQAVGVGLAAAAEAAAGLKALVAVAGEGREPGKQYSRVKSSKNLNVQK